MRRFFALCLSFLLQLEVHLLMVLNLYCLALLSTSVPVLIFFTIVNHFENSIVKNAIFFVWIGASVIIWIPLCVRAFYRTYRDIYMK